MRVLMLTRYGRLGSSSRLRMMQYVPALRRLGIEAEVTSLLEDDYIRTYYAGAFAGRPGARATRILRACARRLWQLHSPAGQRRLAAFDVVWVERELLPWLPSPLELRSLPRTPKLVVDIDDAVFHRYDQHRLGVVRRLFGRKIDRLFEAASAVTAGNAYLAARAEEAGAARVHVIPTVVDLERYRPRATATRADPLTVGWIGAPRTTRYLTPIAAALEAVRARHAIRCVAVGARPDQVAGTAFEAVPWDEATEVELLRTFDVGIMPLPDDPFERGKCGYKLLQYMACGLPVVASPVGVNRELVSAGTNGLLATTPREWEEALGALLGDAELRATMGAAGRRRVDQAYSLQGTAPVVARVFEELVA